MGARARHPHRADPPRRGPGPLVHRQHLLDLAHRQRLGARRPRGGSPVVPDYVEWDAPGSVAPAGPTRTRESGGCAGPCSTPPPGTDRRDELADDSVEFPRIDNRSLTGRHRTIALTGDGGRPRLHREAADALFWFDPAGTTVRWSRDDLAVGELALAPHPDSPPLTTAGGSPSPPPRHRRELAARHPRHRPGVGSEAHVRMPARVPLGLHGAWLPDPPDTPTGETP